MPSSKELKKHKIRDMVRADSSRSLADELAARDQTWGNSDLSTKALLYTSGKVAPSLGGGVLGVWDAELRMYDDAVKDAKGKKKQHRTRRKGCPSGGSGDFDDDVSTMESGSSYAQSQQGSPPPMQWQRPANQLGPQDPRPAHMQPHLDPGSGSRAPPVTTHPHPAPPALLVTPPVTQSNTGNRSRAPQGPLALPVRSKHHSKASRQHSRDSSVASGATQRTNRFNRKDRKTEAGGKRMADSATSTITMDRGSGSYAPSTLSTDNEPDGPVNVWDYCEGWSAPHTPVHTARPPSKVPSSRRSQPVDKGKKKS